MAYVIILLIGLLLIVSVEAALQERRITRLIIERDAAGNNLVMATAVQEMLFEYGIQLARFYSMSPKAFAPGPSPTFVESLKDFFEKVAIDAPAEIPASLAALGLHEIEETAVARIVSGAAEENGAGLKGDGPYPDKWA